MNIDQIKKKLISYVGIKYKFLYKGMRGQDEEFIGKVYKLYPRVFSIITDQGKIKTFSYSDFAIKNLKIY